MADETFVVPGERLGAEEEFAAGENTYVENGAVYAAILGMKTVSNGAVAVKPTGREIKIIDKGMTVLGNVVEDMKSVIFVKIDNINTGNKEYIATKDGKILIRPDRGPGRDRFRRGPPGMDRDRGFREHAPKPMRPCGIGDIIIANVQFNDKDSYALSLFGPETGVVYSTCAVCGGEMAYDGGANLLVCTMCKHTERRKVSALYNNPAEIRKLFE